ncbi:MAG: adenosylcobalamin-dependent ribonucleoside-diphosphate reductase [Gammaproteobacteria bacterium]|nr:adenosylcobalamin-dependent ribonucleoside-diphosphate reductase [Gammaproteobacteria bacterium]
MSNLSDTASHDPWLQTPIARHIWSSKYRWQGDGQATETSIEQSWRRVARAVAAVETSEQAQWEQRFFELLQDFKFLPGGRILAGAGSGHRVTLFNCFVMGLIDDSMEGIFDALKQGALTMQAGGGVGYDFSTLRPRGSIAEATLRIASGPVSFMQIWDSMCGTLLSTGARRGAMLASLRCDHPDIIDFIEAKRDPGALRHFNLSVQVTDAFMQAVADDADWSLLFPDASLQAEPDSEIVMRQWPGYAAPVACRVMARYPARELWRRIMQATYDSAEPGVLFVDRINALNNLAYRETITTTNPCGEIPLPPYGACNLGSINLTRFIKNPFSDRAAIDFTGIEHTVRLATRFLDNIIDCSEFPLDEQATQARGSRRIGLGITGLADALIMLGLHYADRNAVDAAERIMQSLCHGAYRSSIQLAEEKGTFPFFEPEPYVDGQFIHNLPRDIRAGIRKHGIRNSHLTAIAPTGTISLLANNVSSGIEPVFDFRHRRQVLDHEGNYQAFELEDYAYRAWCDAGGDPLQLPQAFVDARSLPPLAHLQMQSRLQQYVDSAISKTINVPEDYAFSEFQDLYRAAYAQGLKGCTTFRPNPISGQILSSDKDSSATPTEPHCCNIEREGE